MINEMNKNKKILLVLAVVLGILIISLVLFFYFSKSDRKELGKDYSVGDLLQEVNDSKSEGRDLVEELAEINKNYSDAVAWVKLLGTSIDSPVFQAKDNDRYLRNDRENNATRWGENFLDYTCDLNKINDEMQHYIIYGHNTEVDTRFTPLLNYKNIEFYKDHQIIELATLEKIYKFQIFSVYKTDTSFYYIDNEFKDKASYGEFLQSIKDKSEYNTGVEVTADDTILTLSTCDYSIKNGRYVVHAKMVK